MTKIGGQCKGCSRAYWEGLRRAKTPGADSSTTAEEEPLPEPASRFSSVNANEANIFNDPERALMNAVNRLTEIQTELGSHNNSTLGMPTATASPVVSHNSYHGLRQEQQTLSARINAIYRCIGLKESHQKVFEAVRSAFSWPQPDRVQEVVQGIYIRSLPYYQILSKCKYKLPGIGDLLQFMDWTFSDKVSSLVTIYELCSGTKSSRIEHKVRMNDPAQLLSHWDILHNFDTPDGYATRPVVLVDGLDSLTIEIFGNALKIHPLVFVRHLWRNLGRDKLDREGGGPPLSQAPSCSLADKHSPRIVLDIEEGMSLRSIDGTSLNGLEDLRSLETLGELHGRQERKSSRQERTDEDDRIIMEYLFDMSSSLGFGESFDAELTKELAVLNKIILRRVVRWLAPDRYSATVLSKLELCATATICTITQDSQQKWSRTLVLRSPSRWHGSPKGTASNTRYLPFSHDPFTTEGLSPLKGVESRGSVLDALCTVVDLGATATTQLNQTEISTIVALSLLRVSVSNVCKMAVSDHVILIESDQHFLYEDEKGELVEVSDGCSILVSRCQRQRDALLLASASAEKLYFAAAGSASSAFIDYVKQELGRIKAITTKTETQLQQTEKVLTLRIDQSFRDLRITLAKSQLEESRKAIKQADTVARLTILAFVFIPISAVCGFFGMNIIEIADDGGFSFWVFGTTMGIVLAMTLLLAFADSIYAMWNYYAAKIDTNMYFYTSISYPYRLLTLKIPYLFRWIDLKVKSIVASGQDVRVRDAEATKQKIDVRSHV